MLAADDGLFSPLIRALLLFRRIPALL